MNLLLLYGYILFCLKQLYRILNRKLLFSILIIIHFCTSLMEPVPLFRWHWKPSCFILIGWLLVINLELWKKRCCWLSNRLSISQFVDFGYQFVGYQFEGYQYPPTILHTLNFVKPTKLICKFFISKICVSHSRRLCWHGIVEWQ